MNCCCITLWRKAKDREGFDITALLDTRALIMTGESLIVMVVVQGPYVMNTDIEILEAIRDY